jgi:hypothetical protein
MFRALRILIEHHPDSAAIERHAVRVLKAIIELSLFVSIVQGFNVRDHLSLADDGNGDKATDQNSCLHLW